MGDDFERPGCALGLFEFLSFFDWVTPLVAIGKTTKHAVEKGTPFHEWTFFFPMGASARAGWSMHHIRKYLRKNGVHIVSESSWLDEGMLSVDLDDAARAEWLLTVAGVPMKARGRGAPRTGKAEFESL